MPAALWLQLGNASVEASASAVDSSREKTVLGLAVSSMPSAWRQQTEERPAPRLAQKRVDSVWNEGTAKS